MTSPIKLLVTDLDNTLYDWVTYFAKSFQAMVTSLVEVLGVEEQKLLLEFKQIHQRYGNSEQPFAILELPSVHQKYPNCSPVELLKILDKPLKAFNVSRREHLSLYPGVADTLATLSESGVRVVGHTEAIRVNALFRLRRLGIQQYFQRLYVLSGHLEPHPNPARGDIFDHPPEFIKEVPKHERKPNPDLLRDICRREGVEVHEACYIGDSITRDMSMAKAAGVLSVWARYGLQYDQEMWKILVRVTHWTDEDVARESELRQQYKGVQPDVIADSFADLLSVLKRSGQSGAERKILTS